MLIDSDLLQNTYADLLNRAAPEKSFQTEELIKILNVNFSLSDGEENNWIFDISGGMYRYVRFNNQALAVFWCGAFAAWKAFSIASKLEQSVLNVLSNHSQIFTDENYDLSTVREELNLATKDIVFTDLEPELNFIETVKNTNEVKLEDIVWSDNIPEMGALCEDEIENKAASELAHIALAWALLHEIQHVIRQQNGKASDIHDKNGCHNEEFECDEYAFNYLISDIKHYADNEIGTDEYKIIQKRELGIMFALFAMVVAAKGCWDETNTHPKLQSRLDIIADKLTTGEAKHISKNMFLVLQGNQGWVDCPHI